MKTFRSPAVLLCLAVLFSAVAVPALAQQSLNDSGLDLCFNDTASTGSTEPATHPRQDCRFGRDAAAASGVLFKAGAGTKAFDFTKVSNGGGVLPAGATLGANPGDWACTFDNVTGLLWEIKTTGASDLRRSLNTYSWYSTNALTNGGQPGDLNGGFCTGGISCDTQGFVAAVNAANLCGHTDWRLPTAQELKTLVDFSQAYDSGVTAIDPTYFPNSPYDTPYWSATPYAGDADRAWYVYFDGGYTVSNFKDGDYFVRVVRSGR